MNAEKFPLKTIFFRYHCLVIPKFVLTMPLNPVYLGIRAIFRFILPALFGFCCCVARLPAQEEDPINGELLENFFRDGEQGGESDAQLLTEQLERLRANPANLNALDPVDLLQSGLVSALQVEQLRAYQAEFGPLLNIYELQAVPGWDLADIERVRPFFGVGTGLDQRAIPLRQGFWRGENELLMRWSRSPQSNIASDYEGLSPAVALRYRHTFDSRLRYGITAEQDAGEAFFSGSNPQGFDFYSAHVFLQGAHPALRQLAVGDYTARFGQGLLLQTGFMPGKSAESVGVARGGPALRPYSAFGEAFFLRGAGATIRMGRDWEATLLYSRRRRDGNVLVPLDSTETDLAFSALQTSGLHRTAAEIADERAVREQLGGISIIHRRPRGHVALNGVGYHFDKSWTPAPAPYRRFGFLGNKLTGVSVDYQFHMRNLLAFGEAARSAPGGFASVNGVLFSADRRATLAVVHRYFGRDYQAIYAAPFSETASSSNERGLYVGVETKPSKPWRINAYTDIWRHPWLRFGADAPSVGWEYLARVIWTPRRGVSMYLLWFSETKERSEVMESVADLFPHRRERLRVHAAYKLGGGLELRSRVEWTRYAVGNIPAAGGFIAFQEAVFKSLSFPVSGTFRFTLFDTADFNTRVYAYEQDLFAALSVPAFSGRGTRIFLNLSWRVNTWLRLEGRYERTLQEKVVTDSGVTGVRQAVKCQLRMKF